MKVIGCWCRRAPVGSGQRDLVTWFEEYETAVRFSFTSWSPRVRKSLMHWQCAQKCVVRATGWFSNTGWGVMVRQSKVTSMQLVICCDILWWFLPNSYQDDIPIYSCDHPCMRSFCTAIAQLVTCTWRSFRGLCWQPVYNVRNPGCHKPTMTIHDWGWTPTHENYDDLGMVYYVLGLLQCLVL